MGLGIRGVIFDLDGTLINSIEFFWAALYGGLDRAGLGPVPRERVARYLDNGIRLDAIFTDLFPGTNAETIAICRRAIREIYVELERDHVKLMPGARELLSGLRSRSIKTGIATGRMTPHELGERELRKFGLESLIDAIVTSAGRRPKPAPDVVVECVQRLGLASNECIFVGDTAADIIAGKAAGVVVVGVTTGAGPRHSLLAEGPHAVVDNIAELSTVLDRVIGS